MHRNRLLNKFVKDKSPVSEAGAAATWLRSTRTQMAAALPKTDHRMTIIIPVKLSA